MKPSAGLPLSVGQASLPLRLVIALVFALTSAVSITGGIVISANPIARVIAILLIVPVGEIGLIATVFILAPHSQFGRWLDHFVPRLRTGRVALLTAVVLWCVAFGVT